jgi:hypothetical protein
VTCVLVAMLADLSGLWVLLDLSKMEVLIGENICPIAIHHLGSLISRRRVFPAAD